jgi:transcriptional regulator of acetoin/glycerol metabolism
LGPRGAARKRELYGLPAGGHCLCSAHGAFRVASVTSRARAHEARGVGSAGQAGAERETGRVQNAPRAGCLFALNLFTAFSEARKPSAFQLETTAEIEHLMARILGRLIVGSEGSVVYQVAESDPRCLALASPRSLAIVKEAEGIALSDRPVLLMGESGVGKELLARFIHYRDSLAWKPAQRVAVICPGKGKRAVVDRCGRAVVKTANVFPWVTGG